MRLNDITPKGRIQFKIRELVGKSKDKGLDSEEIYEVIETQFPLLEDDDMYYTDKLLQVSHMANNIAGGVLLNDIRIAMGDAEGYGICRDWGNVTYTMAQRTQMSVNDKCLGGKSLLLAAIKVTNPVYGMYDSVEALKVVLSVDGNKCKQLESEILVSMSSDEYTKVVYLPVAYMSELEELDETKDFRIDVFYAGLDKPVFGKTFKYIAFAKDVASSFNIITDPYTVEGRMSAISINEGIKGNMNFCLCTSLFEEDKKPQQIQIAMKMEVLDKFIPEVVFLRYLYFSKKDGSDVYEYNGRVFEKLEELDIQLFKDGLYKVSFSFMEVELFSLQVIADDGELSLVESGFDFTPSEKFGDCCNVEDYADTDEDNDDEEDGMEEIRRLLDQMAEDAGMSDETRNMITSELSGDEEPEVRECGVCASEGKSRVPAIYPSNWFFIRSDDNCLHLRFRVSNCRAGNNLFVKCECLLPGGTDVLLPAELDDDEIYVSVPIKDVYSGELYAGQYVPFEIEVKVDDEKAYNKIFTGFVMDSIFDIIELDSVDLCNEKIGDDLSSGLATMVGFDIDEMNILHLQFNIQLPKVIEYPESGMKAILEKPDGTIEKNIVTQCAMPDDSSIAVFRTSYGGQDSNYWEKGRYVLTVQMSDNKTENEDFIKVTFTIGDWNVAGNYETAIIKREILQEKRIAEGEAQEDTSAYDKLHSMIGLEQVKSEIEDLRMQLQLAKKREAVGLPADMPFLHSRFYGNPGTGKTTVAKLLGQIYKEMGLLSKGHVVFAERKTLIAGRWYDSANVATMEAIDKAQGGILFIDEAYNLAVPEDPKDPGQDIIASLLTVLSDEKRKDWMLILAGYPDKMETMMTQNEGFKSRVPNVFHFKDYNPDELLQIAHKYCKDHVYTLTPKAEEHLKAVIARDYSIRGKNFENGRYVVNLLETNIIKRMGKRLAGVEDPGKNMLTTILPEDIPSLRSIAGSRKLDLLNNMIGLAKLKESVQQHLNYVKLCNNRMKAGMDSRMPSLHMVFTGNPGTGKTTVADYIGEIYASMGLLSEGKVLKYTKKDLVGFWIGDTEKTLRELFKRAKGNVLFIDEAYELNPHGDEKDRGRIILDALVDELGGDASDMIVILAGYQKEMEDLLECNPGLKSRFPNVFHFEDYTVEELMKIAFSSKVAEGFVFTPAAKQRLEAYIKREVLKKQKGFGNGRFVNRLLSGTILPRMATRLGTVENPTVRQLRTIVADDIPISSDEVRSVNETGFDEKLINESLGKLDALVGLHKVKQAIHNFVDVARYRNAIGEKFVGGEILKWSFAGNSGTGKSTVAKIFADILKGMNLLSKGNFVEVKGEQIFNVSEHTCDQVLKSAVDRSRYGMLFIDGDSPEFKERGIYALTNDQLKVKLMELTAQQDGAGAIVVAECNAKRQALVSSMIQNGVCEFDHTMVFDDYTPDELYQILVQCLAAHKVSFTPEAADYISKYIKDMFDDKGSSLANARTMKLLSRTVYELVMLRQSRSSSTPHRTVCLCDIEKLVWRTTNKKIGFRR